MDGLVGRRFRGGSGGVGVSVSVISSSVTASGYQTGIGGASQHTKVIVLRFRGHVC
jgi:hypothetical protein